MYHDSTPHIPLPITPSHRGGDGNRGHCLSHQLLEADSGNGADTGAATDDRQQCVISEKFEAIGAVQDLGQVHFSYIARKGAHHIHRFNLPENSQMTLSLFVDDNDDHDEDYNDCSEASRSSIHFVSCKIFASTAPNNSIGAIFCSPKTRGLCRLIAGAYYRLDCLISPEPYAREYCGPARLIFSYVILLKFFTDIIACCQVRGKVSKRIGIMLLVVPRNPEDLNRIGNEWPLKHSSRLQTKMKVNHAIDWLEPRILVMFLVTLAYEWLSLRKAIELAAFH